MSYSVLTHTEKVFAMLLVFFGFSTGLFAMGGRDDNAPPNGLIVASTSWVAAIAYCAGAEKVHVLAPVDLRHPPEYELKPSDLSAASKASLIMYAGWERFAEKLAETAGSAGVKVLQITVSNDPGDIKAEAGKIAELLGTTEKYRVWAAGFDDFTATMRTHVLEFYPEGGLWSTVCRLPLSDGWGLILPVNTVRRSPRPPLSLTW
jgi:hypothetical protein